MRWPGARGIGRPATHPGTIRARFVTEAEIVAVLRAHGPQRIPTLARLLHCGGPKAWALRDRIRAFTMADGSRLQVARVGKNGYQVELATTPLSSAQTASSVPSVGGNGHLTARATYLADGIEYEVLDNCAGPVRRWPESISSRSSLCGESGRCR